VLVRAGRRADTVGVLVAPRVVARCAALVGVACLALPGCTGGPSGPSGQVGTSGSSRPGASARPAARGLAGCGGTPITRGTGPRWAAGGAPTLPYAVSRNGDVVGYLFGYPLSVHRRTRSNKVLWVVRLPRDGHPLVVSGHPRGAAAPAVRVSFPANSSPGEIYPSIIDVPRAGCWQFTLAWGAHVDYIALPYRA
jgi:hypothetical protein